MAEQVLPLENMPRVLGLSLDKHLTITQQCNNIALKVQQRNNVLEALAGSTWGCDTDDDYGDGDIDSGSVNDDNVNDNGGGYCDNDVMMRVIMITSLDLWTNPDKVEPFLATWGERLLAAT